MATSIVFCLISVLWLAAIITSIIFSITKKKLRYIIIAVGILLLPVIYIMWIATIMTLFDNPTWIGDIFIELIGTLMSIFMSLNMM
jgi:hypothetical protein